jgi:aromatic-L-amino-acid/L-tryptophan decarboxylase
MPGPPPPPDAAKERRMIVERPPTGVNGPRDASSTPAGPGTPGPAHPLALGADAMRALGYRAVDALVDRWMNLEESAPWAGADRDGVDAELADLLGPPSELPGMPDAVLDEAIERILPVAARVDHPGSWPTSRRRRPGRRCSRTSSPRASTPSRAPGRGPRHRGTWRWRYWSGSAAGSACPPGTSGSSPPVGPPPTRWPWWPPGSLPRRRGRPRGTRPFAPPSTSRTRPTPPFFVRPRGGHRRRRHPHPGGPVPDLRLDPSAVRAPSPPTSEAGSPRPSSPPTRGPRTPASWTPSLPWPISAPSSGSTTTWTRPTGGSRYSTKGAGTALAGIGRADSVTLDPHKWLFQPFECGCLLVRDPALPHPGLPRHPRVPAGHAPGRGRRSTSGSGEFSSRDPSGRSRSGCRCGVRPWRLPPGGDHGDRARPRIEDRIRASAELEIVTPASLGIVVWQARTEGDPEALHRRIQHVLSAQGTALLSSTRIHGRHALRLCILNPRDSAGPTSRTSCPGPKAVVREARG